LTDHVDEETDPREDQVSDKQPDGLGVAESGQALESGDRDEEADSPNDEGRQAEELQNRRDVRLGYCAGD
jgi:hypothetical protein